MVFSSLHRELGREPSDISHELIQSAVTAGIREQDDLDWKQVVPVKERNEEFAKDVAAMANSGGGLLVFGVVEAPGRTTAAGALAHIEEWGDAEERRLRAVAYSAIQPPVHGLNFHDLESDGVRTVVLDVPSSLDAPHLVWAKEKFTAPLRYGAQTVYMNERQLEAAYASRRNARAGLFSTLQDAAADAVEPVRSDGQVWLSVTGVPTRPRPAHLPRLTSEAFTTMVSHGTARNPFVIQTPDGFGGISPRARYRRWTTIRTRKGSTIRLAEVHDDGTVVHAAALDEVNNEEARDIDPLMLHTSPADVIWLLRHVNETMTPGSEYVVRVNIHTDQWPLYFRERPDGFVEDRGNPIFRFQPVEMTFDPQSSPETLSRALWALVTDILNQGGIESPSPRYLKPAPHGEEV